MFINCIEINHINTEKSIKQKSIIPFSNERLLLADFIVAENFLTSLINEVQSRRSSPTFTLSSEILFQPMEKTEGGISPVERRAYFDLCEHVGGKKVKLYDQLDMLSNTEVTNLMGSF